MIDTKIIENKAVVPIHGLKPGGKLKIEVDCEGTPLDLYWRRRLKDSKTDNKIVFVETKKKKNNK